MHEAIKNICQALKVEAEAVRSYLDMLDSIPVTEKDLFLLGATNMFNNVEHMQSLIIKLSEKMGELIPTAVISSEEDG